ncbi:MAG: hypothetical protein GOMPHAMPRED_002818 [Gomphillus americanus]|uniref:Zn(2)-C6 fungal-type domain-containing protein n=1 Tax=Gomphillus americanus TaxID=1940652 RepID=A0A8H3FF09_9LECA|nr:MAG: hypothetical protein GOMPHAMPRED_002818 [Gomphillus americanus]
MERIEKAPLRISCERCRAQKLRCDSHKPCHRCVKADVSESCSFGTRLRTGRAKRSQTLDGSNIVRNDREDWTPTLPGMHTFTLSSLKSTEAETLTFPEPSSSEYTTPASASDNTTNKSNMLDFLRDNPLDAILQQQSDFEMSDLASFDGTSIYNQPSEPSVKSTLSWPINSIIPLEDQYGSIYSPITAQADGVDDYGLLNELDPLTDLTALLSQMSSYMANVSCLSIQDVGDYPIGDVLFFSDRYHQILMRHLSSPTSQSGTPAMLLFLSCFTTLSQIYASTLRTIQEKVSSFSKGISEFHPTISKEEDNSFYRGLRVSQLGHICLCAKRDPTEKAFSMMLDRLGNIEQSLDLPIDLRVASTPVAGPQDAFQSTLDKLDDARVAFCQSFMAVMESGYIHKSMTKQASEIRERVDAIQKLLNISADTKEITF